MRASTRSISAVSAFLITGLLVLGVSGCGNGGSKSSNSSAGIAAGRVADGAPPAAAGAGAGVAGTGTAYAAAAAATAPAGAPAAGSAAGEAGAKAGANPAALQQRELVRTATVELKTKNVDKTADIIVAAVTKAGGRVDQDNRSTVDKARTASMIVRVPPGQLDATIVAVDRLGTETGRTVKAADVTSSHADINARVQALTTSEVRLRQLLSQSGSVGALLQVESQLTQREADLQSTVAQQRSLGDQISLASLTVKLSTPAPIVAPVKPPGSKLAGFPKALSSGWHALTVSFRVVLAGLGYAAPFLILSALLLGVVAVLRRRRRAGPSSATPVLPA